LVQVLHVVVHEALPFLRVLRSVNARHLLVHRVHVSLHVRHLLGLPVRLGIAGVWRGRSLRESREGEKSRCQNVSDSAHRSRLLQSRRQHAL
jgi:hypothetical protein